eukprot:m.943922 g.943922  ORF g.943922 m.943922 type:complete len:150 (+) comp23841_c0_seq9:1859-2308(+)
MPSTCDCSAGGTAAGCRVACGQCPQCAAPTHRLSVTAGMPDWSLLAAWWRNGHRDDLMLAAVVAVLCVGVDPGVGVLAGVSFDVYRSVTRRGTYVPRGSLASNAWHPERSERRGTETYRPRVFVDDGNSDALHAASDSMPRKSHGIHTL